MPSRQSNAVVLGTAGEDAIEAPYYVESAGEGFSAGKILAMLRRNLWLIAIAVAVTVGAAAYVISREIPVYQATAVIRLIDRGKPVGMETTPDQPVGRVDPVLSELMVLQGRTVLGVAVDRAGFRLFSATTGVPADFVEEVEISLPADEYGVIHLEFAEDHVTYGSGSDRRTARYGEPITVSGARFTVPKAPARGSSMLRVVPRDEAINYLQANLVTKPQVGTGGVDVSFTSTVPGVSPRAVNEIVQVFQEVNAELARQSFSRRRQFLEDQLRTTDSLLMVAQTGLSEFRSREQAYSVASDFTSEQSNLIQVEVQQAQLQGDLRMYQNLLSRIDALRSSGQSGDLNVWMALPGMAGDPSISGVFTQLIAYHTEREAMLAGPWARAASHPEVQRLNVLIASTEQRLTEAVRGKINSLEAQNASLGGLRGRALGKMSSLPRTEVQEVYLTQNLSALEQAGLQLRDNYQAVRLEEAAESGMVEIVHLASRGGRVQSSPWPKLLIGLMTGLMVGLGMAFVREKLDRSISGPAEIERMLLIPNLAVIPESSTPLLSSSSNGHPRARETREPPGAEAYRILRTNLLFSQGGLKNLVVTSAAPGEGKTMTAVNLAASCARQGMRVLLMECDLRRPTLARYFEASQESDITSVMLESRPWDEAIRPSGIPRLDVLLAGRAFPEADEFLAGAEMKRLLEELSLRYDLVILDTSPLLVAADATVLGAIADGVLLVVRASKTDKGAIQQAVHQLILVGARIVGTVLNDPDGAVDQYDHYYDYSAEYEAG